MEIIMGLLDKNIYGGGLNALNRTNPYGLRSWQYDDGSYGGQQMPKTDGWAGLIPSLNGQHNITEYSMGLGTQDNPLFPLVYKGITPSEIETVRKLEAGLLSEDDESVSNLIQKAKQSGVFKDY
jgi:hypothetical protein